MKKKFQRIAVNERSMWDFFRNKEMGKLVAHEISYSVRAIQNYMVDDKRISSE